MMDSIQLDSDKASISRAQFWQEQVKLKQESGLSRADYCRKHNLVCSQFTYWERKLDQPAAQLVPVKLEQSAIKSEVVCTLILKDGTELKIHEAGVLPILLSALR